MPIFAALVSGLMGALASFLAKFVARKVAVVGAALTALATITGAALVTFNALVSPLVAQMFSTSYGQLIGLAFPPVAGTCMATLGAAWAACTLYAWQVKALRISVEA